MAIRVKASGQQAQKPNRSKRCGQCWNDLARNPCKMARLHVVRWAPVTSHQGASHEMPNDFGVCRYGAIVASACAIATVTRASTVTGASAIARCPTVNRPDDYRTAGYLHEPWESDFWAGRHK